MDLFDLGANHSTYEQGTVANEPFECGTVLFSVLMLSAVNVCSVQVCNECDVQHW